MSEITKLIELYGSIAKAADAIGVTQGAFSHWMTGRREMSKATAEHIEKVTGGKISAVKLIFGDRAA